MLHKRFKKFASCLCALLAFTCLLSSVPAGALETGIYAEDIESNTVKATPENIALGKGYTTNVPAAEAYPDSDNELTDGMRAELSAKDANWVGYNTSNLELVVDLGGATFSGVSVGFLYTGAGGGGIYSPMSVKVSYSQDGEIWTSFSEDSGLRDGLNPICVYNYETGIKDAVETRYVKIEATIEYYEHWLFVDEIEIYGELSGQICEKPVIQKNLNAFESIQTGESITLSVEASCTDGGNLSYEWFKDGVSLSWDQPEYTIDDATLADGGTYWVTVTNAKDGYYSTKANSVSCLLTVNEPVEVDPDNLAAGKSYTTNPAPSPTYSDTNPGTKLTDSRIGTLKYNDDFWVGYNNSKLEVVLDLGAVQSFGMVEMNFIKADGTGITIPKHVKVSYSNDASAWTVLSDKDIDFQSTATAAIYRHQCPVSSASGLVDGRYIKIEVNGGNWIFMDEVKVLAGSSIVTPGDEDPIEIDSNNIAYGCSYTSPWPANSSYPDRTGNMLTDGKRGPVYFRAPQWFAFLTYDGTDAGLDDLYVTIDLGSIKSFEQVKAGVLAQAGPAIRNPSHMKVEYSSDNENWTVLADEDTNFPAGDRVNRFVATASAPVSGRYVRVHYVATGWVFVDEIEVLQKADLNEDPNANPDNGKESNLIRGYTNFSLSRTPDINTSSVLTDGLYASTFTNMDPYWAGYKYSGSQNNHVTMEFDLYSPGSISQIVLSSKYDPARKVTIPQNLTLSVANGQGQWIELKTFSNTLPSSASTVKMTWDSMADAFDPVKEGAKTLYVQKLRLEFDIPMSSDTVAIDEVKVIGVYGERSDASEPIFRDETGAYNVALGKPYTATPVTKPNASYVDNGHKLTDGQVATGNYGDPAWIAYHMGDTPLDAGIYKADYRSNTPIKTYTVDLKDIKSIKSISFNTYVDPSAAIADVSTAVSVSVDGETWVPLCRDVSVSGNLPKGIHTYGWNVPKSHENLIKKVFVEDEMIAARYVRVQMDLPGWGFIDEIIVPGYDGQLEGVRLADFGTGSDERNYLTPNEAGGVRDMLLCYNQWGGGFDTESGMYSGTYTPEKLRYMLTYVNDQNQVVDTMFDTVLFLALTTRYGNNFVQGESARADVKDWMWYLDKTFGPGGDVEMLNAAAKQASIDLGDPDYKVNMVIMYPDVRRANFGELDGRVIDYTNEEDQKYAINWWLDEVLERFEAAEHDYVNFTGFYWLHESSKGELHKILYFNEAVHERGYYSYWIPYFASIGCRSGEALGFDGVTYQPNHMFKSPFEVGGYGELVKNGNGLFENFHKQLNYGHMGPEMEMDGRIYNDNFGEYNKWLDYLNAAEEYGYDGPNVHRAWYYADPMIACATSGEPVIRNAYNYSYQLMKGTYTQKDYITASDFPNDPAIGKFMDNGGFDNSGSVGGSTGGGSGSGGGGSVTPKPDDKPDPETPPTGDDNYTWEETDNGYKLKDADGEYVTGWAKVSGKWYYLGADGIRATGWQKVDNKWYYLKSDGVMATGWLKLGNTWYFLNADGVMQTGWLYNGGVWYYLYSWGGMANTSWVQVGNTWYYMRGNGAMMTGWLQQGNTWYYLKDSGAMATGWNWVNAKCYYFSASGKMAANTTVGGYKVDASGAWVK